MFRNLIILPFLICITCGCFGQEISFKDTIATYNYKRLGINKAGMEVLGAWGIANIADGGIGYFAAKQDEWKYFHEMNAAWGVINTGISLLGLRNYRKELTEKLNAQQAYGKYKATKKVYLINSGLEVVYMVTGLVLTKTANNSKRNEAILNGFGKSIVMQGAFLFIFDNFMYRAHARYDSKWYRIMDELTLGSGGIGIRHNFK